MFVSNACFCDAQMSQILCQISNVGPEPSGSAKRSVRACLQLVVAPWMSCTSVCCTMSLLSQRYFACMVVCTERRQVAMQQPYRVSANNKHRLHVVHGSDLLSLSPEMRARGDWLWCTCALCAVYNVTWHDIVVYPAVTAACPSTLLCHQQFAAGLASSYVNSW